VRIFIVSGNHTTIPLMLEFKIEQVLDLKELGQFIFAKQVEPEVNFSVKAGTYLGDIELEEYLDMPRALDEKGQQRNDLFIFKPKQQVDKAKLNKGMIVKLATPK
jgi:hypothetical protein